MVVCFVETMQGQSAYTTPLHLAIISSLHARLMNQAKAWLMAPGTRLVQLSVCHSRVGSSDKVVYKLNQTNINS
jgi:hypothetical protein